MTSTPTTRLRLDKQAIGDNPNAWGNNVNAVFDLLDEAVSGFAEIAVNGNVILTTNNFTSDQARRAILRFTGAGGFPVTIPAVEKMYYIDNQCAADVVLKTAATSGSSVIKGTKRIAYCDGATITTDTSATAPSASDVSITAVSGVSSTNVQGALSNLSTNIGLRQAQIPVLASSVARRIEVNGQIYITGTAMATLNGSGNGLVTFPWAFPTACTTVVVCSGDFNALGGNALFSTTTPSAGSFTFHAEKTSGSIVGVSVAVNYHAVGV